MLAAKAALRQEVWAALTAAGVARFPGAAGRIPNFTGAEAAAERLRVPQARSLILKTGWSGEIRRSSVSGESGPTPPKNTPTSAFHRRR